PPPRRRGAAAVVAERAVRVGGPAQLHESGVVEAVRAGSGPSGTEYVELWREGDQGAGQGTIGG
ncbi:hypothetical protein ACFP59_04980, partial [Microbacterium koreense]|uniref:hypothetical protein n=1 Tax=Microbacterium koreense TaxID=323761 RepID=UPI003618B4FE